jgi:hypothetical protein
MRNGPRSVGVQEKAMPITDVVDREEENAVKTTHVVDALDSGKDAVEGSEAQKGKRGSAIESMSIPPTMPSIEPSCWIPSMSTPRVDNSFLTIRVFCFQ